jgi:hypothetical protein
MLVCAVVTEQRFTIANNLYSRAFQTVYAVPFQSWVTYFHLVVH